MSSHSRGKPHHRHANHAHTPISAPSRDVGVYVALIMGGAFAVLLGMMALNIPWQQLMVGYLAALAFLINLFGWRAWFGGKLVGWQQALARLPLRFAGFAPRTGRPISTARHDPRARTALLMCLVLSLVIIGAALYLLIL